MDDPVESALISQSIDEAVEALLLGGVIAAPTDTLYGVMANALNEDAVARVFATKGRVDASPLPIFVSRVCELYNYGRDIPDIALRLAERFWPGKLTIVVRRSEQIPSLVSGGLGDRRCQDSQSPGPQGHRRASRRSGDRNQCEPQRCAASDLRLGRGAGSGKGVGPRVRRRSTRAVTAVYGCRRHSPAAQSAARGGGLAGEPGTSGRRHHGRVESFRALRLSSDGARTSGRGAAVRPYSTVTYWTTPLVSMNTAGWWTRS